MHKEKRGPRKEQERQNPNCGILLGIWVLYSLFQRFQNLENLISRSSVKICGKSCCKLCIPLWMSAQLYCTVLLLLFQPLQSFSHPERMFYPNLWDWFLWLLDFLNWRMRICEFWRINMSYFGDCGLCTAYVVFASICSNFVIQCLG